MRGGWEGRQRIALGLGLALSGAIVFSCYGLTVGARLRPVERPRSERIEWMRFPPAQLEWWIFEEVNRERAQRHLPPLAWDALLAEIARQHSQDMAARRFFGHITPDGVDVETRLRQRGIGRYRVVAENLALNFDPIYPVGTTIHQWMMSPGHKRNILGPFRYTGVGVALAPGGAYYITQIFLDR